jgi:opacity protein-like surface antigen
MKIPIAAAMASLLIMAFPAMGDGRFAVGVSAVKADVDVNDAGVDVDGGATGQRLFGRFQFTEHFGIEAGYSTFDRPDDAMLPSNLEVESDSLDLFATGTLPLTEKLDVFGKAGMMRWHTETEEDELTEYSSRSTELALGVGGEYEINDRFSVRAEYLWSEGSNSGGIRTASLSGLVSF